MVNISKKKSGDMNWRISLDNRHVPIVCTDFCALCSAILIMEIRMPIICTFCMASKALISRVAGYHYVLLLYNTKVLCITDFKNKWISTWECLKKHTFFENLNSSTILEKELIKYVCVVYNVILHSTTCKYWYITMLIPGRWYVWI